MIFNLLKFFYEIEQGRCKNSLFPSKCFPLPGTFHLKHWNSGRPLDMYLLCASLPNLPLTDCASIYFIWTCAVIYAPGGEEIKQNCVCANSNSRSTYFPLVQSSTVKTETISFGSVSPGGVKLDISTKELPVVHTETKTITYESSQVRSSQKPEPWHFVLPH